MAVGIWIPPDSPLRFAPGGMRQLSSKLLISPSLRCGENQEFETDALRTRLNCRIILIATPYLPLLIRWASYRWQAGSISNFVLGVEDLSGYF